MLVVLANRLDKGNSRQRPRAGGRNEIALVLEMLCATGCSIAVLNEVNERLMMILKSRVRVAGDGVIPAT